MSFFTKTRNDDCSEFIDAFEYFVYRLINAYNRPKLFIIRIDNWFDHKWLGFAGKTHAIYDVNFPDITISPAIWKDRRDATVPPFSPNRIVEQQQFNVYEEHIVRVDSAQEVHSLQKQPSERNLENRILNFCDNALFVWFSSESGSNNRASIMVYHTRQDKIGSWYASLTKTEQWGIHQTKNIDREVIARIFASYYNNKSVGDDGVSSINSALEVQNV